MTTYRPTQAGPRDPGIPAIHVVQIKRWIGQRVTDSKGREREPSRSHQHLASLVAGDKAANDHIVAGLDKPRVLISASLAGAAAGPRS